MRIGSEFVHFPFTFTVDLHLPLDCNRGVDPLAACVIENHDENIGNLVANRVIIGLDHFSDFPVELEEHRGIRAGREYAVSPLVDFDR